MKTQPTVVFVCTLLAGLLLSSVASATVNFCIKTDVTFTDNGYGEDRLTADGWTTARGIRAKVVRGGTTVWGPGYTDSAGCTGTFDPADPENGNYDITIYSYGNVNGQYVYAKEGAFVASTTSTVSIAGSGTSSVQVDSGTGTTQERFNIYVAAADVAYYNDPVNINPSYTFLLNPDEGSFYDSSTGDISIDTGDLIDHHMKKFVIAHEMGHRFLRQVNSGIPSTNCSGFSVDPAELCYDATAHGVTSLEYQRCAWNEGFAHFFAAVAWNYSNAGETTCKYRHLTRGTLDCSRSAPTYTTSYMESVSGTGCPAQCSGMCNSDYDGFGVEWDWWRTFWDAATCPSSDCSNDLDMDDFESWFDGMTTSSSDNYRWFNYLHDEATTIGGDTEDAWLYGVCHNGIDHPLDSISPAPCP